MRTAAPWWMLAVLTLLYMMSLMDRYVITLMFTEIREDLGLSDFQLGLIHGLFFSLFYVSFGLLFGWAADRFARRWIVMGGAVAWSIATFATGLARNVSHLAFARFAVGAGEAALNPAAYSMISDSFPPRRRALAFAIFGTGANLGLAAAMLLGGFLMSVLPRYAELPVIGQSANWQMVFMLLGAPGVLVGALIWTTREPPRRECLEGASADVREAARFGWQRWRFFAGHFVGFALLSATSNAFSAWMPSYMMRSMGLGMSEAAMILALLSLVPGAAGSVFAGWAIDRMFARGRRDIHLRFFLFTAAIQLAALTAGAMTTSVAVLVICQGVFKFLTCFTGIAVAVLHIVTPNQYRGQISAAYLFVFSLMGLGVGPAVTGAISTYVFADDSQLGWSIALTGWLLLPVAMLSLASAMVPLRRELGPTPQR